MLAAVVVHSDAVSEQFGPVWQGGQQNSAPAKLALVVASSPASLSQVEAALVQTWPSPGAPSQSHSTSFRLPATHTHTDQRVRYTCKQM
eukprot:3582252-Rhodomonas_salina.2